MRGGFVARIRASVTFAERTLSGDEETFAQARVFFAGFMFA
jgi:hypothetical protein